MRGLLLVGLLLGALSGCLGVRPLTEPLGPPVPIYSDNPLFMPVRDPSPLWEALADVIDDYFRIESEEPVKLIGDTFTEGRMDTFPEVGSTILEPWRHDSADDYEKVEGTLQSIRRQAHVRVAPAEGGFLVEVAVFKWLEDVKRPAHVSAGAATFRTEGSLTRVVSPIGEQEVHKDWIELGRDRALEQKILAHLQERLGVEGLSPVPPAVPASPPSGPACQPQPPSQPSAPASPMRCTLGSPKASDQPELRTAYRLVVAEGLSGYTMSGPEPGGQGEPAAPGIVEDLGGPGPSDPLVGDWSARWSDQFHRMLDDSTEDYHRFYQRSVLVALAGGIGLAAVFANTSIDENFQEWHDAQVGTHDVRKFAYIMREFGHGVYFVPFYAVCAGAAQAWPSSPALRTVGEWGDRSLRSFLLGGPVILVLQAVLGASRPGEQSYGSDWVPFRDNHSASGHAFIGGTSFITAAMMTDNVPLKSALYVASVVPGWTRIIQDKHYLSQVVLGWWVAYLSANAIHSTDESKSDWLITPAMSDEGISLYWTRAW